MSFGDLLLLSVPFAAVGALVGRRSALLVPLVVWGIYAIAEESGRWGYAGFRLLDPSTLPVVPLSVAFAAVGIAFATRRRNAPG